jgi:hypothetical protein
VRRRFAPLACLAGELAAAGCATKRLQPLDQAALRAGQPRTMVVAQAPSPALRAEGPAVEGLVNATGFAFGLIGVAGARSYAETVNRRRARFMKQCEIADPVDEVREDLAESFAERQSLQVLESERKTDATAPKDIVKDYPGADLILDVRTSKWGIRRVEAPSARGEVHFAAFYEGAFALIDARKGAVVAEATCAVQFRDGEGAPTLNELFEDDCARLRKGIALSAHTCAERYHTKVLGLD